MSRCQRRIAVPTLCGGEGELYVIKKKGVACFVRYERCKSLFIFFIISKDAL